MNACVREREADETKMSTDTINELKLQIDSGDTCWGLVATALVLFMTPGLAFHYGGAVNHKTIVSTMYQSLVSMGVVSLVWVLIGFSLSYGDDIGGMGLIGSPFSFPFLDNVGSKPNQILAETQPLAVFAMYEMTFAIIAPALISGALAERIDFHSWIIFLAMWTILIYCPLCHMVWHPDGFLNQWGYKDFAGGLAVEMASGYSAVVASLYIGKRKNPMDYPSNIPYIILGTSIIWFGWFGFNGGGAKVSDGLAGQIFITTNTAGSAAMITWIWLEYLLDRPPSVEGACGAIVIGLVAITPGCAYVTVKAAFIIGCAGVILCKLVDRYFISVYLAPHIDDTLDVFSVHGVAGTVGVILTGVFCSDSFDGACGSLWVQMAAVVLVMPYVCGMTYLVCLISDSIVPLRISEIAELVGLDSSYHGISLYGSGLDKSNHSAVMSRYSNGDDTESDDTLSRRSSIYQPGENSDINKYLNPKKFAREFSFSDLKEAGKRLDMQAKERESEKRNSKPEVQASQTTTSPLVISRRSLKSTDEDYGNFSDVEASSYKSTLSLPTDLCSDDNNNSNDNNNNVRTSTSTSTSTQYSS